MVKWDLFFFSLCLKKTSLKIDNCKYSLRFSPSEHRVFIRHLQILRPQTCSKLRQKYLRGLFLSEKSNIASKIILHLTSVNNRRTGRLYAIPLRVCFLS